MEEGFYMKNNKFSLLGGVIYYANLIRVKFISKYVIQYDEHTYSSYYRKVRSYADRKTLLCDEANLTIADSIEKGKPFMVARFGSTELYNMGVFDLNFQPKYKIALHTLTNNGGFFPKDEKLARKFTQIMSESSKEIDMLAFWNMFREEYYIKKYMSSETKLFQLRWLEPWFSSKPWTRALKNKKVLVIHPFEDTIQMQYKKRKRLFTNKDILPDFELYTLKAVQTLAGERNERFRTWFEALEWMTNEALKINFDIALIGCGAYGMPLAANLKKAGRQTIHMGGVLQVLFGIKGKRWDTDPFVSALYNEYWVRPGEKEKLKNMHLVEGECYW